MNAQEVFDEAQKARSEERFDDAYALYTEAREKAFTENDPGLAAEALHMIGVLFYQQELFDRADEELKMALDELLPLDLFLLQGAVLRDRGLIALKQEKLSEAENFLKESIAKLDHDEYMGHKGMSQVKLGKVYQARGEYQKALDSMRGGILNLESSSETFFLSIAHFDLAKLQEELADLEYAKESAERSLKYLDQVDPTKTQFHSRRNEIADFIERLSI